jgi:hypothetical protein
MTLELHLKPKDGVESVTGEALRRLLTARLTPAFTCDARLVMGGAL